MTVDSGKLTVNGVPLRGTYLNYIRGKDAARCKRIPLLSALHFPLSTAKIRGLKDSPRLCNV